MTGLFVLVWFWEIGDKWFGSMTLRWVNRFGWGWMTFKFDSNCQNICPKTNNGQFYAFGTLLPELIHDAKNYFHGRVAWPINLIAMVKIFAPRQTMDNFVLSTHFSQIWLKMQRTTFMKWWCYYFQWVFIYIQFFVSANYFYLLIFSRLKSICIEHSEMALVSCWGLHEDTLWNNIWKTWKEKTGTKCKVDQDPDEFKQNEVWV